jgi:hypothetical protein
MTEITNFLEKIIYLIFSGIFSVIFAVLKGMVFILVMASQYPIRSAIILLVVGMIIYLSRRGRRRI